VVKNQDGSLQTIEGFEKNFQSTGTLLTAITDGDAKAPNKTTDPVYYVSDVDSDATVINCLKSKVAVVNAMQLNYHYLGSNSNRFVVEAMGTCGRSVKLPWRAVGATQPFNPPIPQ
jgi:hypothetical protein